MNSVAVAHARIVKQRHTWEVWMKPNAGDVMLRVAFGLTQANATTLKDQINGLLQTINHKPQITPTTAPPIETGEPLLGGLDIEE